MTWERWRIKDKYILKGRKARKKRHRQPKYTFIHFTHTTTHIKRSDPLQNPNIYTIHTSIEERRCRGD